MRKIICASLLLCVGASAEPLVRSDVKQFLTPKQQQILEEKEGLYRQSQIKKPTFLYLVSESMGAGSTKAFNQSIHRLQSKGYDVQGMVVLRGFPKDLKSYVISLYEKGIESMLKIHPFFFRNHKIERVPAYILALCHTPPNFSIRTCDTEFVIKGDIALSDFLRRVSNEDKKYLDYYYALIGTTADKNK